MKPLRFLRFWFVFFIFIFLFLVFACEAAKAPALKEDIAYGKLTVYSDIQGSDIFVDAKFVGQDRATISNIPVGKHYVRVVKEDRTIQSGLVDVKEGEETIIVAKPAEEELLSRFRKPNLIHVYMSYSSLNHTGNKAGSAEVSGELSPFYGVNFEGVFPVPLLDFDVILGFRYNLPAPIKAGGVKLTDMTISGPYGNVSKKIVDRLLGNRNLSFGIGGGINYSFYSGELISITGSLGYQLFAEVSLRGENQLTIFRAGYLVNTGKGSNQYNFTNSGYFVSGGIAYPL